MRGLGQVGDLYRDNIIIRLGKDRKMERKALLLALIIAVLLSLLDLGFGAPPKYEVIDLGTLGGRTSLAFYVNNNGRAVGWAKDRLGDPYATLFDPTGSSNNIGLGAIGGRESSAKSINDRGQIVGWARPISPYRRHATLFDPTGSSDNVDLGTLGGNYSDAYSINDSGQIVGWADNSSGYTRATLFDPTGSGDNIDLGTLGGSLSGALSINNSGQIVGGADKDEIEGHATLFDPTGNGNNTDLGTLGGNLSCAHSINDHGQIVGWAENGRGDEHATLFDPTGRGDNMDLGTLGGRESRAYAINDRGQIVGEAQKHSVYFYPTLFDPTGDGNNVDLNVLINPDSGWTLEKVYSINNSGWIVGWGKNPDRKSRACLLIPRLRMPIYYVDALRGDDDNDGLSPETAFATIQKGIDSAADGDAVLVYPGLYAEEINFKGKTITVQSAEDAAVLEAPGNFAVSFYMGEGPCSILKNFVICNSYMGIFIAHSSPTITNVTVANNTYGVEAYAAEPSIASSIFWNNSQGDLFQCEPRYSCIERSGEGEGNLSVDPLFVDPDNGDYRLLSEHGRYWPEHDVWVLDKVTSPCIDAGDPTAGSSTEPTPNGGRINMGAYGGTAHASMSERPCAGDINYDGIINMVDLAVLAENWLKSRPSSSNQPPCVIIAAPTDGAKFWFAVTIELKVDACDTDGRVVKVEFYAGGKKIGTDYDGSDGWGITWADYSQGSYTITAKATDDRGATTTSPEIEIEIRASPPPRR